MGHETRAGGGGDTVEMRLNRGVGIVYCAVAAVVALLVLAGIGAYVTSGRVVMAFVVAVAGLAVAGFLAVVAGAMILPALTVDVSGVRGRTARGGRIAAEWGDITLDVDDNAASGTIRMNLDGASLTLSGRSWLGFRDFVLLVASTPAATSRLSQPARTEVVRLLQIANQLPGDQGECSD